MRHTIILSVMEILSTVLASRLWVRGTSRIKFGGRSDWTFMYCLEGTNASPHWILFFYNNQERKIFLRSPTLDLKVSDVVVQKAKYISNVYTIMIERFDPSKPLQLWETPKSSNREDFERYLSTPTPYVSPSVLYLSGGLVCPTTTERYFCTPPILFRDSRNKQHVQPSLSIYRTQHSPLDVSCGENDISTFICQKNISGYTSYRLRGDSPTQTNNHKHHSNRTWISSIFVDQQTFECQFKISRGATRAPLDCLECWGVSEDSPSTAVNSLNTTMSNLMINH